MFRGLSFDLAGVLYAPQYEIREQIMEAGGKITNIKNPYSSQPPTFLLSSPATMTAGHEKIAKAKELKVIILDSTFIPESLKSGGRLPLAPFQLWPPPSSDHNRSIQLQPLRTQPQRPALQPKSLSQPDNVSNHVSENRNDLDSLLRISDTLKTLPLWHSREAVVAHLRNNNRVAVICGSPGCGKSTVLPQLVVDSGLVPNGRQVLCVQNNQHAAIATAEFVAKSRQGQLGNEVGYQVRFVNCSKNTSQLVYTTSSILLRRLQVDPNLGNVGCIILDEAREGDVCFDLLLVAIRNLIHQSSRSPLRLILTGNTVSMDPYLQYLEPLSTVKPFVALGVAVAPVRHTETFLEDALNTTLFTDPEVSVTKRQLEIIQNECKGYSNDVITRLAGWKDEHHIPVTVDLIRRFNESPISGSILVFLPSMDSIYMVQNELESINDLFILTIHPNLSGKQHTRAYLPAPSNKRKVILCWGVEDSLAFDDVFCVIDSGIYADYERDQKTQAQRIDYKKVSVLLASQRASRVRVEGGFTVHLVRKQQLLPQSFPYYGTDLSEVALLCKALYPRTDLIESLKKLRKPIDNQHMKYVLQNLNRLQCLSNQHLLTKLGQTLARVPIHPMIVRSVLWGAMLRVLKPISIIAAFMAGESPFLISNEKNKLMNGKVEPSDHLSMIQAYVGWRNSIKNGEEDKYCAEMRLSKVALNNAYDLVDKFVALLMSVGYDGEDCDRDPNKYAEMTQPLSNADITIVKVALSAGFCPNIAQITGKSSGSYTAVVGTFGKEVPVTVDCNFSLNVGQFIVYTDSKQNGDHVVLRDITPISPIYLLLLCNILQKDGKSVWADRWSAQTDRVLDPVFILRREIFESFQKCVAQRNYSLFPNELVDKIYGMVDEDVYTLLGTKVIDLPIPSKDSSSSWEWESEHVG